MKEHKILIVDDEPDNLRAIRNCMAESDELYTLFQALNGELALKIAATELPNLIITDWEMPGMDGIELIQKLKQNEITSDIPVIMCTGVMTTSENLYTALMAGAVDFIRKPIDQIELIARVKSMLQLSDSRKVLKEEYLIIEQNMKFINILIESIPFPFVYYTLDGIIKGCNSHFEYLLGLINHDIIGTRLSNYELITNNDIHINHDHRLINERLALTYESELAGRIFLIAKTLYSTSSNKPEGILCIMTDITDLKQAHQEILENKKRELASSALRLIHLNEMNHKLILDLEKIGEYTNPKGRELVRTTIKQVGISTNKNVWQEFETRFENVYESFYQTLNQMFPDLTPGEKKLCAFLRLNLSSKDIAALTFQDPKSVDMARYRLRKKMELKPDENLIDFLMKIN
jgi:PAS domain S-box-containing protein